MFLCELIYDRAANGALNQVPECGRSCSRGAGCLDAKVPPSTSSAMAALQLEMSADVVDWPGRVVMCAHGDVLAAW
ncbi:hypothetical protein BDA96_03G176300 [Sorghum bicolor]|uniref:Uncharacterized protein n=1 Tax=Sorghum bicolor TaxID=4558 RepID=A0A921RDN0_SORBI|nr:hypothetical protein BDA96_03G176300 [Sorghum bicolor]